MIGGVRRERHEDVRRWQGRTDGSRLVELGKLVLERETWRGRELRRDVQRAARDIRAAMASAKCAQTERNKPRRRLATVG